VTPEELKGWASTAKILEANGLDLIMEFNLDQLDAAVNAANRHHMIYGGERSVIVLAYLAMEYCFRDS
jgi:hypothetical protein